MKAFIVTSSPWSGLQDLARLLGKMGLHEGQANVAGQTVNAENWHQRMLAANEHRVDGVGLSQPLRVSKLWEDMALALFKANLHDKDWFMADHRATWTLDFWRELDGQTRFLLGYVPAEAALKLSLEAHTANATALESADRTTEAAEDWSAESAAAVWLAYNKGILQFLKTLQAHAPSASARGARGILVNIQEALLHPDRLQHTLGQQLGARDLKATTDELKADSLLPMDLAQRVSEDTRRQITALNAALAQAATPLTSASTAVVLHASEPSPPARASLFAWVSGRKKFEQALADAQARVLSLEANQVYLADLVEALTQKNTAAETQLRRTRDDLAKEQSNSEEVVRQLSASSDAKLKDSEAKLKDSQDEAELLLTQLHQVQEELERIYLEHKKVEQQLADERKKLSSAEEAARKSQQEAKQHSDKAQAADAAKAAADKAKAELDAKLKEQTEKLKATDAAKAAAEKAKAELDAKLQEQTEKLKATDAAKAAAEKAKVELDAKLKNQIDQTKAAESGKANALNQLATQKKSTEDQEQKLNQETQKLKEAQEENELLLTQLHQVQEELENYYLRSKELSQGHSQLEQRLTRVLQRLPVWADAEQLRAQVIANDASHKCLKVQAKQVWVGHDLKIDALQFLFGVRDDIPYLELRPGDDGLPEKLMNWPRSQSDQNGKRLLLAPHAPGELGAGQRSAIAHMSAQQWQMVRSLIVLVGSHVGRLNVGDYAERTFWGNAAQRLAKSLEAMAPALHYESAEVISVSQPSAEVEVMRVAVRNAATRTLRIPLLVFDLGLVTKLVRKKPVPQLLNFEFRQWKSGATPFNTWQPNAEDDNGPLMRLTYGLTSTRTKPPKVPEVLTQMTGEDLMLLQGLQEAMHSVLAGDDVSKHSMKNHLEHWQRAVDFVRDQEFVGE